MFEYKTYTHFIQSLSKPICSHSENKRKRIRLVSTGSCPRSPAPFLISAQHTQLLFSSSIISHLLSISQGLLSELPAYYIPSMRARRKSLERSKPFICRCDLIDFQLHFSTRVHLSAGGRVELSLQWSKRYYYRRLLPEMSVVILELEQIGLSAFQGLWAQYYTPSSFRAIPPSLLISPDGTVHTIPLNPGCCHLPLSQCDANDNKTSFLAFHFHCLFENVWYVWDYIKARRPL